MCSLQTKNDVYICKWLGKKQERVIFYDVKIVCNQVSSVHKSTFWNTATLFDLRAGCGCFYAKSNTNSEAVMETGLQILKCAVWPFTGAQGLKVKYSGGRGQGFDTRRAWRWDEYLEGQWEQLLRDSAVQLLRLWSLNSCVRVPKMMVGSGSRGPAAQMPESLLMTSLDP